MKRRTFIKNGAIGMASFAGTALSGLGAEALQDSYAPDLAIASVSDNGQPIGRPVRIVSIGFNAEVPLPLAEVVKHVDGEGAQGVDVIILPELCQGQNETSEEPLHGPTVTAMAELAKKHKTYIAVPIDRRDGKRRLNSMVFLDRAGQVACIYNKVFPYWSEFDHPTAVSPGEATVVYQADFGRVGFATCFDANFPEVWRSLADKGAELVLWPSAYSGGTSLQAHAINHHYYIVSCTQAPDCMVYDITGELVLHSQAKDINVSRVTLDLDRGIYHENFNIDNRDKRDKLLREHAHDIEQDKWLQLDQWFVLKAKRPGVSARALAHQYGLEELRHYLDRSRQAIDKRRGWEFDEKVVFPDKTIADLKSHNPKNIS